MNGLPRRSQASAITSSAAAATASNGRRRFTWKARATATRTRPPSAAGVLATPTTIPAQPSRACLPVATASVPSATSVAVRVSGP